MSGPGRARLEELLERAREIHVLVVGDLMLDRYITGDVDRISPEAPVPVVRVESESHAVGGAGNVAANVTALGARCDVVGLVGDDEGGRTLEDALGRAGVGVEGLVECDRPTTVKIRVLARRQQIVRVDREVEEDAAPELAREMVARIRELAAGSGAVAIEDYNKGVLVGPVIDAALGRDGNHGLPSVVDPKRLRFFDYRGATVFKPNAKELTEALSDHLHPEDPGWMEEVRRRLGCEHLLLTLGDRGVALKGPPGSDGGAGETEGADGGGGAGEEISGDGREEGYLRAPAVARDVFDVSGAGDTVTAVMAVALAAGATAREGAILANHAAAVEVGKVGVATVSPEEILAHWEEYPDRG